MWAPESNLRFVSEGRRVGVSDQSGLFQSKLIGRCQTAPVEGLDTVKSGQSYTFHGSLHPGMRGTLIVR
jgi:hypothetical protein